MTVKLGQTRSAVALLPICSIPIQLFSATLAEMRFNRTLMERSINCLYVVSPAGGNFASAYKPASSAVIKKLICPNRRGLMTLPLSGVSSVWCQNTELFSLGETFANFDILDDSASCWSIGSLEQKNTRLFCLERNFCQP